MPRARHYKANTARPRKPTENMYLGTPQDAVHLFSPSLLAPVCLEQLPRTQHGLSPKHTGFRKVLGRWRGRRSKNQSSFISRLYAGSRCRCKCCYFFPPQVREKLEIVASSELTLGCFCPKVARQGEMAPRRPSRLQGDEADVGQRYAWQTKPLAASTPAVAKKSGRQRSEASTKPSRWRRWSKTWSRIGRWRHRTSWT